MNKTDITNLVFSEIDIKQSNFDNKQNKITMYSLGILSENEEHPTHSDLESDSSDSINLDNYNLDIESNKYDINTFNNERKVFH